MCGRTACTLERDTLCRACGYKDSSGKNKIVPWMESELEYKPSPNMGPRDVLPCITTGSHFKTEEDRVLCEMMWGMIPPWHEGDYKKHTLSTHNARLENIENSKLYSPPLHRGQRCIVVCEGYYEWKAGKTKKEPKQPYFIYARQEGSVRIDDDSTWQNEWVEESGWRGIKLLKMAGIFNTFKTDGKTIYSCSVITTNSNKTISWLHDRVPVFVNTEEKIEAWLNKDLSTTDAVSMLKNLSLSEGTLSWHPVSTVVNNVLNKSEDCKKEIKVKEEKKSGPTGLMASWLQKGSKPLAKRESVSPSKDEKDDSIKDNTIPTKKMKFE